MPEMLPAVPPNGRYRPGLSQQPVTIAAANSLPSPTFRPIRPSRSTSAARAGVWTAADTAPGRNLDEHEPGHQRRPGLERRRRPARRRGRAASASSSRPRSKTTAPPICASATACNGQGDHAPACVFSARIASATAPPATSRPDTIALIDQTFPGGGLSPRYQSAAGLRRPSILKPSNMFGRTRRWPFARKSAPSPRKTMSRAPCSFRASRGRPRASAGPAAGRPSSNGRRSAGDLPLDPSFKTSLEAYLDVYRMAGYDLEVEDAMRVPLQSRCTCASRPGYVATDVEAGAAANLSPRISPTARWAMFNPQRLPRWGSRSI